MVNMTKYISIPPPPQVRTDHKTCSDFFDPLIQWSCLPPSSVAGAPRVQEFKWQVTTYYGTLNTTKTGSSDECSLDGGLEELIKTEGGLAVLDVV